MHPDQVTARAVLHRHGITYAAASGIRLKDQPAPLFQLLVLAQLLSARIGTDIAVATAAELFANGWTTRSACARLPVERDPGARPRRLPPVRRAHRDRAPRHGAARARPVRRRPARARREQPARTCGPPGCCRRSRASAPPAPPSSSARCGGLAVGASLPRTTGHAPVRGESACPRTRLAGRPRRRRRARPFAAAWCGSRCCPSAWIPSRRRPVRRATAGGVTAATDPGEPMQCVASDRTHRGGAAAGDAQLVIDLRGGGLRALTVGEWTSSTATPPARSPRAAAASCCRGRTGSDGRWTWEGRNLQLDIRSGSSRTRCTAWSPAAVGVLDEAAGASRSGPSSSRTPGTRSNWPRPSTTR